MENTQAVRDPALTRAGRTLDDLLRTAPDRVAEILEDGDLSRTLGQLQTAENPAPEWVRAKTSTLRLKYGAAAMSLWRLGEALREALTAWQEAGGDDPVRLAQAGQTLQLIEAKRTEMRGMRQRMTDLFLLVKDAEEAAIRAELAAALARLRSCREEETE